ncbi:hypothetical protein ACQJ79_07415, partial [Helicobacter pylori]
MQNSLPKLIIKHLSRFAFSYETPCDDLKSERIIFLKSKRIETNKIFTKEICRLRFVISKAHGSNQPFFLKNKNAPKRF